MLFDRRKKSYLDYSLFIIHSKSATGISPAANIFRLATASRAGVALRRKCEPIFGALCAPSGFACGFHDKTISTKQIRS